MPLLARLIGRGGALLGIPLAQVGSGFDVALTVERAAPATGATPELAFTGAPLLVLFALLSVLVATGFNVLATARRREARVRGGAG